MSQVCRVFQPRWTTLLQFRNYCHKAQHTDFLHIFILKCNCRPTLDINRWAFTGECKPLAQILSASILHANRVHRSVWCTGNKHKHPDVQIHAWCKPTETWCKWFSVSQPAPGHSQTMRSQPERDRCQLCFHSLPDRSVRSCRGSARYRPALSHTFTALSHTCTLSADQIHNTTEPGKLTQLN